MSGNQHKLTVISFGPFEADLQTQELRKLGVRLRLPGQSFQILKVLLERPGELATREELHKALWPSETFVDFEHGVNAAMNRLREVLGDSADSPKLIETLPRRGYRFIGKIEVPRKPEDGTDDKRNVRRTWLKVAGWTVVGTACVLVVGHSRIWDRKKDATLTPVPITTYPGMEVCPSFSPDGSQIAFGWNGNPEPGAGGFDLYVKVIGGESLLRLTYHPSDFICPAWSPDGTQIAFHRESGMDAGVYVVPALGGPERKLRAMSPYHTVANLSRSLDGMWANMPYEISTSLSWSPDGEWIAYVEAQGGIEQSRRVYRLSVRTLHSGEVFLAGNCPNAVLPTVSPDGSKLAYVCLVTWNEFGIYSITTSGESRGSPDVIGRFFGRPGGIAWTIDGKRLVFSQNDGADIGLYEIALADRSVRKLPFGQNGLWPTISAKGDKLAYTVYSGNMNIWRRDLLDQQAAAVKLIPSSRLQEGPQYSPDGTHIAFESTRGGAREIWVSDVSGNFPVQITDFENSSISNLQWSPDSQQIAFDVMQSGQSEVFIVDISGRNAEKLMTNIHGLMSPSWSRDGKWIYFNASGGGIYRCPANGGNAIFLPRQYGFHPLESFDRKTIFSATISFDLRASVSLRAASSEHPWQETPLSGITPISTITLWTITSGGIYFVPADEPKSLHYFDLKTKRVRQVFEVDKVFGRGLSVSPDGRWILYSQMDEGNSDIMLYKRFN